MNATTALEMATELRRRDFHALAVATTNKFVDGWIYVDICTRLRQFMLDVRDGKSPRLILTMPPRMGKSVISSIRFPVYCLLNNPDWEVIVATYGQSLTNRFSRAARTLLSHDYIKYLWPEAKLARTHSAVGEWKVTQGDSGEGGTYRAVSRGGAATGSGASVLCIDDIFRDIAEADSPTIRESTWEWYNAVAQTRLAPGGGIVLIQTRWNTEDLVGKLLQEAKDNSEADQWEVISYKAIAEQDEEFRKQGESILPERWSIEELQKKKASMIPRIWEFLYQQNPVKRGGNMIKEVWLKHHCNYDANSYEQIIQCWDLRFGKSQAKTSSFVCGWVIAKSGGQFFLLDEARGRWSYAESRDEIRKMSARWPTAAAKIIENKANGPAIESDLEKEISGIILYNPRGDKIQRLEVVLPYLIAGNFHLPENSREIKGELCVFPTGADKDRVDVLSMGLSWYMEQDEMCLGVYRL